MAITLTPPTTSQPTTTEPALQALPMTHVAGPAALDIEHLSKKFEVGGRKKRKTVVAVNDVSLRIERGEIYGLLGANGSGKSTFIRLVSTLLTVEHGRVAVFGHDIVRDAMAVKRLINRVSVDAAFFKKLSPNENLMYAARLYPPPAPGRDGCCLHSAGRVRVRLGRALCQADRQTEESWIRT
ncbi:MAG: ATP-binding cassette domain-containing protein [Chloroflexota bacterium]|nr:ATP-binding cassette domain-containing protein [Chloroflexota bacterium]